MKLTKLPAVMCTLLHVNAAASRITVPRLSELLTMPGQDVDDSPSDPSGGPGAPPKVPGDNNLFLCGSDHDEDIGQLEEVDLLPNPPQR